MWFVLLTAIRRSTLLWGLLHDAPPWLLEEMVRLFEPRWLLPCELVVADEEPDCDFLFVVIHGSFVIMLEGAEIDRIEQGAVQGEAQLLGLNDWTRSVIVDPLFQGEAMIQILRRDRLLEVLERHPQPKMQLRKMENDLSLAKDADWRILLKIPTFKTINYKPFLERVFKDADILMYSPGDHIGVQGRLGSSLVVILAGVCRAEQAQTLFCVEMGCGDWCYQDNYLGNEKVRDHELVVVKPTMVLTLHRHTLLNAVVAYPVARSIVLENETWRGAGPELDNIRIFQGVPPAVTARLVEEASPRYFRQGSRILEKGQEIEDHAVLLVLRGELQISILNIETRKLGPGDTVGLFHYLGLPVAPHQCEIMAVSAVDALCIPRDPMFEALLDDRYDDAVHNFKDTIRILKGGEIVDAFGFPLGGGGVFAEDCVEKAEIFAACSAPFRAQLNLLIEDVVYFPGETLFKEGDDGDVMFFLQSGRVELKTLGSKKNEFADAGACIGDMAVLGQTPGHYATAVAVSAVWARALDKRLLNRAFASFRSDEGRVFGAASAPRVGVFDD